MYPGCLNASRRAKCLLLVSLVLALSTALLPSATILISKGAGWRYLDDGSNQGTAWREPSYNDDEWGFGHGELGYGDDDEVTLLSYGPDPNNRYITYYFRRFFYVADPAAFTNVLVKLLRDDGAVVYLNGTEVIRSGMPDGPIDGETFATPPGTEGAAESRYFNFLLAPELLVKGVNLMAVEVHQVDFESPDVSFDLELSADGEPDVIVAALTRGPYLQLPTTNGITVRWRTDEPADSRVRFGLAPNALQSEVVDGDEVTEHQVRLPGLLPNRRYYYAVGTTHATLASGDDYTFVTAPMAAKPTRVWAMGDCGTATSQARAVFEQYRNLNVLEGRDTDVWLMLGDNAYGVGADSEYQTAVFEQYPELLRRTAVWSTLGNHETYSIDPNGEHAYFNMFTWPKAGEIGGEPSGTEHYYSFNYGNIHLVCLDSEESPRTEGGSMLTWLEEDLAGNHQDWLIVFWHSPPYTKGSHDSDNLFDNFGNMTQMRENIVPLLEAYGADLVLCGHSHNYERSFLMNGHYGFSQTLQPSMVLDAGSGRPEETGAYLKTGTGPAPNQGTLYIVAGSSGFATFQTGRHPIMHSALLRMGSLVLDIDGQRLDGRFLRETGAVDDWFTVLKGASAPELRMSAQMVQGQVTVSWKSSAGRTYVVERSWALDQPWQAASPEIVATGATTTWMDVAQGVEKYFYRVVQVR